MNYLTLAALHLTLLACLSATVGTVIVLRERSFFAVALSHATFPGGVVAAIAGVNVLFGQAIAAVILVLLMALLSRVRGQGMQAATGIVLAFGFALGALLSSLQQSFNVPVDALLVGSLFGVQPSDTVITGIVLIACLVLLALFKRQLLLHTFDPAAYRVAGFGRLTPELVTATVVAAAVVVSLPAVGAILSVALLVGPPAIARLLVSNVVWIPPLALVIALLASGLGLWVSVAFSVAAGGAIGVIVAVLFGIALLLQRLNFQRGFKQTR